MTFAYLGHGWVGCVICHHEFQDRSMTRICIACHVADTKVSPRLEDQFHTLGRACHATAPTRRCDACHLRDELF